ncbi:calmodulin-regulated spectrin-associated protein 1-B isoform X1 [Triplophysa rosa]|uniref:Calmodulin-regulated spectrin-associated protein 1-B n=1 Tax=Triplophysa rosa TaxID=992332 RepID=A0A9W7X2X4_TRIRA|nr:calmodulin-regulated spectrin-associated protein 1-B isoform X1 [Triplophysa rosa]XP_057179269.1 calmodulin-regulated spectrin-associated protein 1-B isoform X1 [Triplophysa rosa]KAI7812795.1 putative calmodulin-regulated spectrin-associated protein 1-B [Triplophysa rosa]
MEAELGADSARRKMEAAGEMLEIVPLEMYDSARAKIAANLRWLFAKAFGFDHIPEDLRDPFYTDQYEQEHIKPPVIRLLLSCELYCRVCALVLKGDQAASLQSHLSVIQALSRKGIYVMEGDDTPVSDADLTCQPIKMSSHIPMIDALMMAYTVEMISIEKVVSCVKRFSTFSASKELPFDLEDAMVFWINKVNLKMREITEKEHKSKQHLLESPSHQKSPSKWYWKLVPVRYRRDHASGRQLPYFPLLEDLIRDVCDGAALLTIVHYYCPDLMKLDDICLKEVTSIADSLYNIQLLKEFAIEYLNKCFYLTLEDMLYAPPVLKHNVMVFIAELFWWFEIVKPEFVQPRDVQEFKDARAMTQPKSARPAVPISNATKRSFLVSPGAADPPLPVQNSPEVCNRYFLHPEESEPLNKGSSSFSPSHPLLPLRQRQKKTQSGDENSACRNRSNSFTQEGHARGSMAWSDKRQRPLSQLNRYVLHSAADSDADLASGDSVSMTCSISEDSLASTVTPKHQIHSSQASVRRVNGHSLLGNVNMDEENELVAIARAESSKNDITLTNSEDPECQSATPGAKTGIWGRPEESSSDSQTASFFLEPLMPAVLRPAKEKTICLNKEEEYGEVRQRGYARRAAGGDSLNSSSRRRPPNTLNRTFTPNTSSEFDTTIEPKSSEFVPPASQAFRPLVTSSVEPSAERLPGFYLHQSVPEDKRPVQAWDLHTGSDIETVETIEEQDAELTKELHPDKKQLGEEDEESAKLREDMNVKEHEDKDGGSRCSSPGQQSQVSSVASGSIRMTSFAERKMQRFGSNQDIRSSASSSQRTTPDGSESCPLSLTFCRMKREQSPTSQSKDGTNMLASELVQLHMQLEEKRRAIESQKKKMEVLTARKRLKLGKAAFLHIVKKGKSDTLPQPAKSEYCVREGEKMNEEKSSKDDSCVDALRDGHKKAEEPVKASLEWAGGGTVSPSALDTDEEIDMNECNRSIELLNEAIGNIQQQMMQLSLQQELIMKQNLQSPLGAASAPNGDQSSEPRVRAPVHFVEPSGSPVIRKPPKLSSARSRSKPSELLLVKEYGKGQKSSTPTPTDSPRSIQGGRTPKAESEDWRQSSLNKDKGNQKNTTFHLNDEANLRTVSREPSSVALGVTFDESISSRDPEATFDHGPAGNVSEDLYRGKVNLIEVDLSDLAASSEDESSTVLDVTGDEADGDKKPGMGFFFKDEQKAEDELAKKRAAFLLKQQRKAEEARFRKQQLEVESELKRDEARRKAEEDRTRKEEEKARRELIKQEYLRRKQQEIFEEQEQPKPKLKPKKQRPKSVLKDEPSNVTLPRSPAATVKLCSSPDENLISAKSGSNLSLASVATTEPDSVNSGGAGSQRGESVESFPGFSRHSSRTTERDWDNGSTASSITSTSMAEYTGPKLFKEPSAKSNKPIIHNAISHCCLAGKVNEPQKNSILEILEKCESNHLMILFRDGGCQFRALYSYFPDTEDIHKLTGTGPKSITKKMIDKLYKYSSDRKQFTVIPAKTVSVSVDALTIHNHLWQAKRPAVPKKSVK